MVGIENEINEQERLRVNDWIRYKKSKNKKKKKKFSKFVEMISYRGGGSKELYEGESYKCFFTRVLADDQDDVHTAWIVSSYGIAWSVVYSQIPLFVFKGAWPS